MDKTALKINNVDEYIASFPPGKREILRKIRLTIKKSAPKANERISYGMPFYEYGGTGYKGRLIYFAAFKKHISLFIIPRQAITLPKELQKYHVSKATYQFPLAKSFPLALLEKTVKALVKERDSQQKDSAKKTAIAKDILAYNSKLSGADKTIGNILAREINKGLPKAENKIWHAHPVWFLDGNPVAGYSRQKAGIRLMFWSGASFDEEKLRSGTGKFKDASVFYSSANEVNVNDLKRWLRKAEKIQWDYKNIVKRKGKLERLK